MFSSNTHTQSSGSLLRYHTHMAHHPPTHKTPGVQSWCAIPILIFTHNMPHFIQRWPEPFSLLRACHLPNNISFCFLEEHSFHLRVCIHVINSHICILSRQFTVMPNVAILSDQFFCCNSNLWPVTWLLRSYQYPSMISYFQALSSTIKGVRQISSLVILFFLAKISAHFRFIFLAPLCSGAFLILTRPSASTFP
jgi:hypothetical protein